MENLVWSLVARVWSFTAIITKGMAEEYGRGSFGTEVEKVSHQDIIHDYYYYSTSPFLLVLVGGPKDTLLSALGKSLETLGTRMYAILLYLKVH